MRNFKYAMFASIMFLFSNTGFAQYDSSTLVDTNNTTNETSNVTTNNTNTNNNTSTSTNTNTNNTTVNSTNTNTNTNTNNNTSTSTNTNTNNNVNTSTSTSTSTVNQTINQTSTIDQTTNNTNVNTSTSTNTNTNTNNNTNVNTSTSNNNNVNQNKNDTKIEQTLKQPPPTAVAPSMMSGGNNDLCTVGISGAVQTQILGFSGGSHVRDLNCERLKLSKTLYDMGMKVAAVATLCQDDRIYQAMWNAGTPCPIEGKIGDEAKKLWEENPERQPANIEMETRKNDTLKGFGLGAIFSGLLLLLL